MLVRRIKHAAELHDLATAWDKMAGGVPFRSFAWLTTWWKHFASGELFVLVVTDGGEVVGIAPWFIEESTARGRVIRFLGSGAVCSDYLSILIDPEQQSEIIAAMVDWLDAAATSELDHENTWDLLLMENVESADDPLSDLVDQLAEKNITVHVRPASNCWQIPLPDTWDDYLSMLSKSGRKQLRQLDRRKLHSSETATRFVTDCEDARRAIDTLFTLHQRRRTSLGQPGCFACQKFQAFIDDCVPTMLASGLCEIPIVEVNGQAVSVELHLLGDDSVYAYQAGIEPNALDEEPGRLITIAALQRAIQRRQRAYDFCRGDEPYKAHWRALPQSTLDIRVVPNNGAAQLRHNLWLTGNSMKQWLKSSLQSSGK